MDYLRYIEILEGFQKTHDRTMYLQLINLVIAIGKETTFEDLRNELRIIYKSIKATANPYSFKDGTIINKKAYDKLQELIIILIDLLNDYYGHYKILKKE